MEAKDFPAHEFADGHAPKNSRTKLAKISNDLLVVPGEVCGTVVPNGESPPRRWDGDFLALSTDAHDGTIGVPKKNAVPVLDAPAGVGTLRNDT